MDHPHPCLGFFPPVCASGSFSSARSQTKEAPSALATSREGRAAGSGRLKHKCSKEAAQGSLSAPMELDNF